MPKSQPDHIEQAAQRAAELIAEIIDEGLRDRRSNAVKRRRTRPNVGTSYVTVFNAPVHINGGPPVDPDAERVHRALREVLKQLPEAGLSVPALRHARKVTIDAVAEAEQITVPKQGQLRRLIGAVSTALVTGAASGGANPIVQELVRNLQHVI